MGAVAPQFIVAEVSKNWHDGVPATPGLVSHALERVIQVNLLRGYRLHSFTLDRVVVSDGELNETIVAVFEAIDDEAGQTAPHDDASARGGTDAGGGHKKGHTRQNAMITYTAVRRANVLWMLGFAGGVPTGIRTRVSALKGLHSQFSHHTAPSRSVPHRLANSFHESYFHPPKIATRRDVPHRSGTLRDGKGGTKRGTRPAYHARVSRVCSRVVRFGAAVIARREHTSPIGARA